MEMLLNAEYLHTQTFWLVVSFVALLAIMWKFVTPMLTETLDARANQIREDLDRAANLKTEAEQMLQTYEKQLKTAQAEAADLVAQARKDAEDLAAKRTKELEAELSRKAEVAAKSIEQAQNRAMEELRKEVVNLTVQATEKVVGSMMDSKTAKKFADEALNELN
ncbi:MAG: ATP synthase F0 subunit B [Magnetococcales bacterium]|nr:ATP synthase F0 subunit B [Magnetococcales bacterium]MEC8067472.1 F0F1 ATP synthase subunit B [Pseudomonadota bacterium]|tara:strand:- start:6802 stop:7296 length:495 start_codon:yes stop_codon:yes gene_type:complete